MKRHRLGLVVGKFAPLHRGHEFLIEQAIADCEQVLVVGYSHPEFPGCGRERRKAWVERRFPEVINVQIDDAWLGQLCAGRGLPFMPIPTNHDTDSAQQAWLAWVLKEPLAMRPDAMFASEPYVVPASKRLSQEFGQAVTPVCVDAARTAYPISSTRIRKNPHAHRQWLHPDVYRDFVQRVVMLGGESSGKTTLAQALAIEFETCWVPEYGRELWHQRSGHLSLQDLVDIGRIQIEREEAMLGQAQAFLFCDTSALTTLGYAGWMFGEQPEALRNLACRPYTLSVLCETDFAFVQDGTRQNALFRQRQHKWYEEELTRRENPVLRVSGSLSDRVQQVRAALMQFSYATSRPGCLTS